MQGDPVSPNFFSLEFHLRFFPRFLRSHLKSKKMGMGGGAFTSTLEMIVSLAVCFILAAIGIPFALTQGSILGWILTIIGIGGICVLFIQSVGSQWGYRPTYDDFLAGVYFLAVALGIIVGIPVGMDHHSPLAGVFTSVGGFLTGHVLGIGAGLQLQRLGWIGVIVNMLAGFGAICLSAGTCVMLVVVAFG